MDALIVLELGLLLVLAKIFGEVFERIKLPSILGEISLGVIVGPVLGIIIISQSAPVADDSITIIKMLAEIGAVFLLFSIGFEKVKVERLSVSLRGAFPVAIIGAAFPFSAGCVVGYAFSSQLFLNFSIRPDFSFINKFPSPRGKKQSSLFLIFEH